MRFFVVLATVLAVAATARAENLKKFEAQEITIPAAGEAIGGYLAAPESPGRHAALVVLHEDWGLTNWVKEQARKLAAQGYVALAVDLYRGQVTYDAYVAYDLMVAVSQERALQDMQAAFNLLASRPDVDKQKIGCIGWSAGGKWALLMATNEPRLAACVSNYGGVITDPGQIQNIHAPILAIFGADDHRVTPDDLDAFQKAMDGAHKMLDLKVYPGAASGFENSENKLGYREGAADDAWQRTLAFLHEHLK